MAGIFTVASREFSDMVRSKRFLVLIVIFTSVMIIPMVQIYVQVIRSGATPYPDIPGTSMPRRFLGTMGYMLAGTFAAFAPIISVGLGCDAISGEREKGTLKIIMAQPIYRDTVINGKFVAATSAVSLAILITSLGIVGVSTILLGVTPTVEETLRIGLYFAFSILFTMTFYGLAAFISTIIKKTSLSVILSIGMWAVFAFVIPMLASMIAMAIAYGGDWNNYMATFETIYSLSPSYHFSKIGEHLLGTYSYGPPSEFQETSVTSSLMYAGPNILVLAIVTTLFFIASYITFTRQEIR